MKDETKELFDAPWVADACCEIHDKNESLVCICCPGEPHIANRLARLPELYDALVEAMQYHCSSCVGFDVSDIPISNILKNCQRVDCCAHRWLKLLQKVRNGE